MNFASMTQRQPTAGSIEELAVNWINTQDDLATIQTFDGGWEHPAQMQIALLMKNYGNPGQTLKEKQEIYLTPKKRVDLFVQQEQPNANGHPNIGVELKCRTKGESKANFQRRVLEDIKKIHDGVKGEVRPVLMYSMAITNSPMDLDWSTYDNTKYPDYPKSYFKVNGWYVVAWGMAFIWEEEGKGVERWN